MPVSAQNPAKSKEAKPVCACEPTKTCLVGDIGRKAWPEARFDGRGDPAAAEREHEPDIGRQSTTNE
jgi:hypothetical protein